MLPVKSIKAHAAKLSAKGLKECLSITTKSFYPDAYFCGA